MRAIMKKSPAADHSMRDEEWRRTFISRLVRSDVVDWVSTPEENSTGMANEVDRGVATPAPLGGNNFEAIAAIAAKTSKGGHFIDPATDFIADWDKVDRRRKTRRELLSLASECSRWSRNLRRTVGLTVLIACTTVSSMIFHLALGDDGFEPQAQVTAAFAGTSSSVRLPGEASPVSSSVNGGLKTAGMSFSDAPELRLGPVSQAPAPVAATNQRTDLQQPPTLSVERIALSREALPAVRAEVASVRPILQPSRPSEPRATDHDRDAPAPRILPFEAPMALGHQPRASQQLRAIEPRDQAPASRAKVVVRAKPVLSRQTAEYSEPKSEAKLLVKPKALAPAISAQARPTTPPLRPMASREPVSAWSPFRELQN